MELQQTVDVSKCLSNPVRIEILEWLKDPVNNFPENSTGVPNKKGVCVGLIQKKTGLSQSTISSYLNLMVRCGLLKMFRLGKWSYYSRNEKSIKEYLNYLK